MSKEKPEEIFPVFDQIINRQDKEKLLKQKAKVIWLTGLFRLGQNNYWRIA
jgi:adenylylsulfate kinase-like enzyme